MKYAMSIQNIIDIYEHRGVPKYRDRYSEAYVIFISNLKGGNVKKTAIDGFLWRMQCVLILIF